MAIKQWGRQIDNNFPQNLVNQVHQNTHCNRLLVVTELVSGTK